MELVVISTKPKPEHQALAPRRKIAPKPCRGLTVYKVQFEGEDAA